MITDIAVEAAPVTCHITGFYSDAFYRPDSHWPPSSLIERTTFQLQKSLAKAHQWPIKLPATRE